MNTEIKIPAQVYGKDHFGKYAILKESPQFRRYAGIAGTRVQFQWSPGKSAVYPPVWVQFALLGEERVLLYCFEDAGQDLKGRPHCLRKIVGVCSYQQAAQISAALVDENTPLEHDVDDYGTWRICVPSRLEGPQEYERPQTRILRKGDEEAYTIKFPSPSKKPSGSGQKGNRHISILLFLIFLAFGGGWVAHMFWNNNKVNHEHVKNGELMKQSIQLRKELNKEKNLREKAEEKLRRIADILREEISSAMDTVDEKSEGPGCD